MTHRYLLFFALALLGAEARAALFHRTAVGDTVVRYTVDTREARPQKAEPTPPQIDEPPTYAEGERVLLLQVNQQVNYPKSCFDKGVEGIVRVQFVITRKGKLRDAKIVQSLHPDADAEVLRVVRSLPGKWIPGRHRGQKVDACFTLPVRFILQ